MNDEKRFTRVIPCRHCGNSAPMQIVASHDEYEEFGHAGHESWEHMATYELCLCPACSHLTLREVDHISHADEPPITVLYLLTVS